MNKKSQFWIASFEQPYVTGTDTFDRQSIIRFCAQHAKDGTIFYVSYAPKQFSGSGVIRFSIDLGVTSVSGSGNAETKRFAGRMIRLAFELDEVACNVNLATNWEDIVRGHRTIISHLVDSFQNTGCSKFFQQYSHGEYLERRLIEDSRGYRDLAAN